ncbi:MAG: alpha/beta hydrolase, partial [Candidatus Hodarchaeota archaeon]
MKIHKNWLKIDLNTIANYYSIILNSISIVLGIVYILTPSYSTIWDVFGTILLITLFNNLFLIFLNSNKKNETYIFNTRMNLFNYIYLIFIILAMVCMMLGNLLISVTYSNKLIDNLGAYVLIYLFYFGTLFIGIVYAIFGIREYNNIALGFQEQNFEKRSSRRFLKPKKILKKIITIISRITFLLGILFGIVSILGSFEIVTTFIAIVSGQFGIFFSIIFLANTILLLKLRHRNWNTKKFYKATVVGILVSGLLLVPLFLTQHTINDIESNFSSTFGPNWSDKIPPEVNRYFLETPFSLSSYFLGLQPKDCKMEINNLFYDDEGIQLYFDAYMPLNKTKNLPGENSTIIRIHGGGWVSGDKGLMNMMQMNKYFAAQGYTVFDIQYGIAENPLYSLDPLTPDYKKGNFNIDDMMRHIGIFTKYLNNYSNKYGANLDSVFISGGSAGGHLTCAVALAIASGDYSDLFSANLTIKGL